MARNVAGLRVEDARQLRDPPDAFVAPVPDQGHQSAGCEHARDLGRRRDRVEPVERLRGDHGIDARAGQRDVLGDGVERLGRRGGLRQQLAHPRDGLERDHARAAARECARQLAGAGTQLEQRPARRGAGVGEDRLDRARRVAGAAALVGGRGAVEADRGLGMDARSHARRSGTGSPGSSSMARKPSGTAIARSSGRRRSGRRAWIS